MDEQLDWDDKEKKKRKEETYPIVIIEYYSIGCSQIDSQSSGTSRKKETEYILLAVERLNLVFQEKESIWSFGTQII